MTLLQKFYKISKRVLLALVLLVILLYGVLHFSPVQTWLVGKIAGNLSERLDTRVTIKKVDFRFFDNLLLKGIMIEDKKKDTMLSAGLISLNITDWFFFKDKIKVHDFVLEDAIVNLHRSDSIWNYQFLLDYFSSPSTGKKKSADPDIEILEAHLKNIQINKIDQWIGQDMKALLQKLDITIEKMDLKKKQISIDNINLVEPYFAQSDYEGNKPKDNTESSPTVKVPVVSAFKWNNEGWVIKLKKLEVSDGTFKNDRFTERPPLPDMFDGLHLKFSAINGSISNVLFLHDTLQGNIALSANERSGLEIKKLHSFLKFTPEIMEFNELDLRTNKSRLGNYYAMHFISFNNDMSRFLHNVKLEADFKESILSTDDLAIFAPDMASMKRTFYIEGKAKGTVDNFSAKKMLIKTGNTIVDGDVAMRGLPDINSTFIDFNSRLLQTNYNELITIIPSLKNVQTPALNKLGAIRYTGNFTGFINDFVAYGNINTNLGHITADLNMKLPAGGEPTYSGKLKTDGFNLGQFVNDPKLGSIALNGVIKGKNFSLNKLNANFNGQISRLDYAGYSYQNIDINGDFKNRIFKGNAAINDPNVKISSLDGEFSLSGKQLAFNANAILDHIDFKKLGFSQEQYTLAGNFSLNFTGNNIDNFLGSARVTNANLQHEGTKLSFDSLLLKSYIGNNQKFLSIESNELDAKIVGQFKIMELPDAFSVFLGRYYPSYIKVPSYKVENQDFSFSIRTNNINEYVKLFDKKLQGFNDARIDGSLQLNNSELKVKAFVPEFNYDGKVFTNTNFDGNGNKDTLFADIAVQELKINDSLYFPDTKLKLAAHNDLSVINLKTSASQSLNQAELNASIQTLNDGVRIHFFPSTFELNKKLWRLEKDGELRLSKNFIDASEVKFVSKEQQIIISSELDELTDDIHLIARLKNVVIEDILPFWVSDPELKGKLTGLATISDPLGKMKIKFDGFADSFYMDKKYIGKVDLNTSVNTVSGMIEYAAATSNAKNAFKITGYYDYKDSLGSRMNTKLNADIIQLNILEPYLGTIFSNIDGTAKGNIEISGADKNMTIIGDVMVDSATLKVGFTQCSYTIKKQKIHFGKNLIDLGNIQLKDKFGNTGTASGKMYHKFFQDFSFENVRVETGKMLVLNTTKKDNSQFYGNVIGSALMTMNGPLTNLQMNIDGQPSSLDSSHIYIPIGETGRENTKIDYIDFIQFGSEMDKPSGKNKATDITINMNITANPACKVDVILDEETGDIIRGQGNGKMNIRVGSTEPLTIRGRYDITKGEYTFNFQTFVKKPFELNRGSITWSGDPYLAIIDIDAEYLAKNVEVSSLTQSNDVKKKEDIIILSHLTGNLTKPEIKFEFELPEGSPLRRDYFTMRKLADFQNNETEMFKQVASLLLVNSFLTSEQGLFTGGSTFNIATSTIGGVLSSFLTNIFNKELERATKGVISTYIDINPTVDLQSRAKQLQANVRAGLKIFLSSRLNLLVGGNLDYNNPFIQTTSLLTPDITIEWLLNNDGSLRVVFFSKTGTDITLNQRNRSGAQLSYRKDFDKLSDLFKRKPKPPQIPEDSIKISRIEGNEE